MKSTIKRNNETHTERDRESAVQYTTWSGKMKFSILSLCGLFFGVADGQRNLAASFKVRCNSSDSDFIIPVPVGLGCFFTLYMLKSLNVRIDLVRYDLAYQECIENRQKKKKKRESEWRKGTTSFHFVSFCMRYRRYIENIIVSAISIRPPRIASISKCIRWQYWLKSIVVFPLSTDSLISLFVRRSLFAALFFHNVNHWLN